MKLFASALFAIVTVELMAQPIVSDSHSVTVGWGESALHEPQHVAVSEFEATGDPELWKPDKIDIPVLMVRAKQPAWAPEYERFVRSFVPNLDYQVWDKVSHFVMMEKPREFNKALVAFLEKNQLLPNRS